jgi:hypothetical protein
LLSVFQFSRQQLIDEYEGGYMFPKILGL